MHDAVVVLNRQHKRREIDPGRQIKPTKHRPPVCEQSLVDRPVAERPNLRPQQSDAVKSLDPLVEPQIPKRRLKARHPLCPRRLGEHVGLG